jgi:hypothetical protein
VCGAGKRQGSRRGGRAGGGARTHCTAMRRNFGEFVAVGSMSAAVNMVRDEEGEARWWCAYM